MSNSYYIPDGSTWALTTLSSDISITNQENMKKLTLRQKATLSKQDKTLLRARFLNDDLTLTDNGKEALLDVLFDEHKGELVKRAKLKLEELKESK